MFLSSYYSSFFHKNKILLLQTKLNSTQLKLKNKFHSLNSYQSQTFNKGNPLLKGQIFFQKGSLILDILCLSDSSELRL